MRKLLIAFLLVASSAWAAPLNQPVNDITGASVEVDKNGVRYNATIGTGVNNIIGGNDSRLSDARTPSRHGNEYHSANYLVSESDPSVDGKIATHSTITYNHSLLHGHSNKSVLDRITASVAGLPLWDGATWPGGGTGGGTTVNSLVCPAGEVFNGFDSTTGAFNCVPAQMAESGSGGIASLNGLTQTSQSLVPGTNISITSNSTTGQHVFNVTGVLTSEADPRVTTHESASDPHSQYMTSAETASAISGKADSSVVMTHTSSTSNPHSVTKAQVGLSNVDNTSDANKPVSTFQQAALDLKADTAALGTAAAKNIPVSGNASATEVVYGTDTRLSDDRTPKAHVTSSHSDWPASVSMTELGYLDGVTGAIQTQLNNKQGSLTAGVDYLTPTGSGAGLTGIVKSESDPQFSAWNKSSGISITTSQISNFGNYEPADSTIIKESELSSATNSTSTITAANSAAVKSAYDLAAGKASSSDISNAIGTHTSGVQHGTTAQEQTNIATAVNHAGSAHATVQPAADGKRYIWKNGAYVEFNMAEKVKMELAENPRAIFWVYGPSKTGACAEGDEPNIDDGTAQEYQKLINIVTAPGAGGSANNVRWLCDEVAVLPNPSFQATSGYVTIYGEAGALTDMTVGGGTFNAVGGYVMAYGGTGEFVRTDIQGGTFDAVSGYVTVAGAAGSMTFKGDVMAGASGYVLAYGQAGSLTEQAPPPSGNFSGTIFGTPTDFTITGSNITVSNGNLLVKGGLGDKAEIIVSSFARPFYVEFTTSFPTVGDQSGDRAGVEVGLYSGISNAIHYITTFRDMSGYDDEVLVWVHIPNIGLIANGAGVASQFTSAPYNATWRIEFLGNGTIAYKRDGSHVTGSPFTNNAVTSGFTTIRLTPALVDGVPNNLNVTVSNFSIGAL
jgi:hypothetical protein